LTDNSVKIILDLCGGTGSWSKPYLEGGYDVRVITLPQYDIFSYEPPGGGMRDIGCTNLYSFFFS